MKNQFTYPEILYGWLEIIRPPNLFTIAGDILTGASLALIGKGEIHLVIPVLIVSLFLYISGLILNDYFDAKIDRVERPSRPIPSGKVRSNEALIVSMVFMASAVFLGSWISGVRLLPVEISIYPPQRAQVLKIVLILAVLIVLYNGAARKIPWTGFIVMGLCRGCNILLGAAVVTESFNSKVFYGAGIEMLYIISVSALAYTETKSHPGIVKCSLPYISLLVLVIMVLEKISPIGICVLFITLGHVLFILRRIRHKDKHIPERIGELVSSLMLIQCTIIAIFMDHSVQYRNYYFFTIAILYMLFFASRLTAKKFYGS